MRVRLPSSSTFGALSAWSNFDTFLQRLDITTDPNFWDGLQSLIPYQDYFLESQYHDLQEGCETPNLPNQTNPQNPPNTPNPECLCANSPFYAYEIHGIECTEYRLLYWYHPDYLGHNEFITDNSGLPYQYFHYSVFGETLVEDNAHYGQFSSPYRFNAKELDQETGNYYYGASSRRDFEHKPKGRSAMLARPSPAFWRGYYNPTWGVWLEVDPWANKYPYVSPFNFVENNPIRLVDPDGNGPWPPSWQAIGHLVSYFSTRSAIQEENPTTTPFQEQLAVAIMIMDDVPVLTTDATAMAIGIGVNLGGKSPVTDASITFGMTGKRDPVISTTLQTVVANIEVKKIIDDNPEMELNINSIPSVDFEEVSFNYSGIVGKINPSEMLGIANQAIITILEIIESYIEVITNPQDYFVPEDL